MRPPEKAATQPPQHWSGGAAAGGYAGPEGRSCSSC